MKISVVIITKNEAHIIANTLRSVQRVTDDIVVVDSGSTDETVDICKKMGANVIQTGWAGYGANKNRGIKAARHNWILSLDADEAIDQALEHNLLQLSLQNENEVFSIRRKNFFCNKWIRFGEWASDWHVRLFNRNKLSWNNATVHENLVFPEGVITTKIKGSMLHYTVQNQQDYIAKMDRYASMNAEKYSAAGKTAGIGKQYFSPAFSFLQNYIFRLGFLDGKEGFIIAKTTARYTFLKYFYLKKIKKT